MSTTEFTTYLRPCLSKKKKNKKSIHVHCSFKSNGIRCFNYFKKKKPIPRIVYFGTRSLSTLVLYYTPPSFSLLYKLSRRTPHARSHAFPSRSAAHLTHNRTIPVRSPNTPCGKPAVYVAAKRLWREERCSGQSIAIFISRQRKHLRRTESRIPRIFISPVDVSRIFFCAL